jgi:hypothetical protein
MQPIDAILRELQTALNAAAPPPAPGDGGQDSLGMPAARFEELRAEAAATCRAVPGARVAALQIETSPYDARGAQHIIDLLRRVARDRPHEPHAA